MGFEVHRDTFTFDRWEEKRSSVFVNNEEIHLSSAFPQQHPVVSGDGNLVLNTTLQNTHLKKAKEMGVQAVILV
ncbi:hypothetical protein [Clostridium sp. FP1]|uniref:hypothetical protein n=1 Tax=Clostridium sp. FP1 TaxID=2724076 RepID=UPI0013E905F6|nr:hypothetical protein [Clostridium sp. FP1]MBZ9637510.1 hypothetical protein [Clostridium sp. FP1]